MKRTPVIVVAGQEMTDDVCETLARTPGTIVVRHRFDGHVVVRSVRIGDDLRPHTSEWPLELTNCCVDCTIREDLLILLRRLHRRDDARRIVVHLAPWLEPEPVCWAINNVIVRVGPGYTDGPAARDVRIEAVVSTVHTAAWLTQALDDEVLDDDRTVAQVVVGQAEFADVLVLSATHDRTSAVLRRLAPRSQHVVGPALLEPALAALQWTARRGREHNPHEALLAGQPPLGADGDVELVEFNADRPFHPMRLHIAIDDLLDGVVRVRGRAWLATQPDAVVWIESAGGGMKVGHAGEWLASSAEHSDGYADPVGIVLVELDTAVCHSFSCSNYSELRGPVHSPDLAAAESVLARFEIDLSGDTRPEVRCVERCDRTRGGLAFADQLPEVLGTDSTRRHDPDACDHYTPSAHRFASQS